MPYSVEQVEDAILEALAPLKGSMGIKTIDTIDEAFLAEDMSKTIARFPAIFSAYTGSDYEDQGQRQIERINFTLFIGDKSLRSKGEARRGGHQNPGAYAVLKAVREALAGKALLPALFPIMPGGQGPSFFQAGAAIYSALYKTGQVLLLPG